MTGVKTDDKKQHFDHIYVEPTPVSFKEKILDELEYVSDDFNKAAFERLILPWALAQKKRLNFVDLCACFGNTTMATLYDMGFSAIKENWKDETSCMTIDAQRQFDAKTTAIDISKPALAYGKAAGIYDETIAVDLNHPSDELQKQVETAMSEGDIFIATAALVYLEPHALEKIIKSFAASSGKEGYVLVNFLNPFALEKADATKRLLLEHLDFVGSMASKHRRLSDFEQENFPTFGEFSLLEIWVLKRRC